MMIGWRRKTVVDKHTRKRLDSFIFTMKHPTKQIIKTGIIEVMTALTYMEAG